MSAAGELHGFVNAPESPGHNFKHPERDRRAAPAPRSGHTGPALCAKRGAGV